MVEHEGGSGGIDTTEVEGTLSDLGGIRLERANGNALEGLWNDLQLSQRSRGQHYRWRRWECNQPLAVHAQQGNTSAHRFQTSIGLVPLENSAHLLRDSRPCQLRRFGD